MIGWIVPTGFATKIQGVSAVPQTEPRSNFETGDAFRRSVLGDEYVDRSLQNTDPFIANWRRFATEVPWGQIWSRPGLELRQRSLCTVAALVALGDTRELRTHLRGALHLGIPPEELAEVFIQVAGYAGMPKAGAAFEVAYELLQERAAAPDS